MNGEFQTYIEHIKKEEDIFAKAKLLYQLVHVKNIRIVDVSKALTKTPSYICHLLRIATLPEIIVDGYYSKLISISHLFVISRIKDKKKLFEVYELLLRNNFTVQKTEELVRSVLYKTESVGKRLTEDEIKTIVEKIKNNDERMSIKIIQTRIKGKIIIEVKGSLEKTTASLKQLLAKLTQ